MNPPPEYHNGQLAPTNTTNTTKAAEEWEDDDVITPIDATEQVQICPPTNAPAPLPNRNTKSVNLRASRLSTPKVRRIRSRQRQKAQNAKAGIRLITDMSVFRRNNHATNNMRSPPGRKGKFVDAAALRALEGEPSSASVGNWNWLKKGSGKTPEPATEMRKDRNKNQQLSPEDRPIVIGISLESSGVEGREISPQTALVDDSRAPFPAPELSNHHAPQAAKADVQGHKSVWSPDTPDTSYSFRSNNVASSVYSQFVMPNQISKEQACPPVPELPSNYKKAAHQRVLSLELGNSRQADDESGTPCTLFEEDGVPSPQRHPKSKEVGTSPDSAASRSHGWWDHVVTPFVDKKMSFSSQKYKTESPKSPKSPKFHKEMSRDESWVNLDVKEESRSRSSPNVAPAPVQAPIVRAPTPRRTPSPQSDTKHAEKNPQSLLTKTQMSAAEPSMRQTPQIVISRDSPSPSDVPPPYSPPKKKQDDKPIRYRAVFPPGHPLHSQFPPTPRPASPGLAGTMTSQRGHQKGALNHTSAVPTTQTQPATTEPLPVRAVGTFVPQEHAYSAAGSRHKVERRRRRHEKEDIVARRAGGFWRGRGCMSSGGCFGRTGREGRKRRRVWMAIWAGVIALILLIILLAVLLTRNHSPAETPSIWVNLTDFPPMPTGVLTVVGPDNTAARSVCTEPSTLWSCSLPKDQQSSVLPYKANQPTLIMQIQWDNGTRRSWNVANADAPAPLSRRAFGAASHALSALRRDPAPTEFQFLPDPAAPNFREMWFLGETTDNIKSDQKGGEPAPFYISLLRSTNDTVPTPNLSRRGVSPNIGNTTFKDLIPPPDLEKDGTSAPAVMIPNPVQQPVRLFDRGLPTEHYGFYTYFKRTIFLKSVNIQNNTDNNIPLDEDGGCRKTEASHLVTWGDTRLHVQIWTRALSSNTSSLLKADGGKGIGGTGELVRPGTMPYPVTITQDTHGGDPDKKLVWDRPIDDRLQVATTEAQALVNNMENGGTWVNKRGTGDAKFGGFDGGSGGCKCEWVNWV